MGAKQFLSAWVIFHALKQTVGGSEQCPYESRTTKVICLIRGGH